MGDGMNNYVATIYEKKRVGDAEYIYTSSYTTLGEYDEETQTFIDRNGREYPHITSEDCIFGNEDKGFANAVKIKEIKSMFTEEDGIYTINDAISRYDELSRESILLVGITPEGVSYTRSIELGCHIDDEDYKSYIDFASDNPELDGVKFTPDKGISSTEIDNSELVSEEDLKSGEVNPKIAAIMQELGEGVYSLEDLRKLRENIRLHREDLDVLLDQVDMLVTTGDVLEGVEVTDAPKKVEEFRKPKKVKIPNYIDIDTLRDKITATVKGQDDHVERIITEIIRKDRNPEAKSRGILLTGSTGIGKTTIMKLIAKYLDKPFFEIDTLGLTVPGYVGKDIEEELYRIYEDAGRNLTKVENSIIYFDEIDKKNSEKNSDVSGRGVLNLLLKFIEGKKYSAVKDMKHGGETVTIDTSNMIVFVSGAYNDVYNRLKAEHDGIGFGNTVKKGDVLREATSEDFIKLANSPDEFIGRVLIIKLDDLTDEIFKEILTDSEDSELLRQIELFKELGVELTYTEGFLMKLVENAKKKNTGARGLKNAVEDATWAAYNEAYKKANDDHGLDTVTLTEETVEHPKVYEKTYK